MELYQVVNNGTVSCPANSLSLEEGWVYYMARVLTNVTWLHDTTTITQLVPYDL